jgi:hypothetical protein
MDDLEKRLHQPETSGEELYRLAEFFSGFESGEPDHGYMPIRKIVDHPNITSKTLDFLSGYGCRIVRNKVAQHPRTTTETLKKMLEENNYEPWNEQMLEEDESLYDRIKEALQKRQIMAEQRQEQIIYKDPNQLVLKI